MNNNCLFHHVVYLQKIWSKMRGAGALSGNEENQRRQDRNTWEEKTEFQLFIKNIFKNIYYIKYVLKVLY